METLFRKSLGDTPKIRVLEFLIEGRELDYSITDIAEGAEIGRTTLFRVWGDLIENKIIKEGEYPILTDKNGKWIVSRGEGSDEGFWT